MANWWKCKIVKPSMMIPFSPGEVIFAKNGDEYITLFDGRQETRVPKRALKYLQLIARLQDPASDQIQQNYEHKMDAMAAWDHSDVTGQERTPIPPSPSAGAPIFPSSQTGAPIFPSSSTGEGRGGVRKKRTRKISNDPNDASYKFQ